MEALQNSLDEETERLNQLARTIRDNAIEFDNLDAENDDVIDMANLLYQEITEKNLLIEEQIEEI